MSTTITTTNTLTANDADIEDVEDADDGSVEEETSPDIPACLCKGLFLFHILSPVAFCYLPSFMSFSILHFSQV